MASSLSGSWVACEVGQDGVDTEHYLIFGINNVEYEVTLLIEADKKLKLPCKGKELAGVGTYLHYMEENSQFTTTVFSHYLIVNDASSIPKFNKQKLCGVSSWRIMKRVDCSDDEYLRSDLGARGRKTVNEFILKDNELHIIGKEKTFIYYKVEKKK